MTVRYAVADISNRIFIKFCENENTKRNPPSQNFEYSGVD